MANVICNQLATGTTFGWNSLTKLIDNGDGGLIIRNNAGTATLTLTSSGGLTNTGTLTTGGSLFLGGNTVLASEAANTLAIRNGTNNQTFNLYGTYTDTNNYERGMVKHTASALQIFTQGAGTGSARGIEIGPGNAAKWAFNTSGVFYPTGDVSSDFGGSSNYIRDAYMGRHTYVKETATTPTATPDTVIIYAKDNGSGKTQLMALFPTGAAVQIAIEP